MAGPPWWAWYDTARWKQLRLKVFERDRYRCQHTGCCKVEGNTSKLICDHIKPHRGNEHLFWNEANLQTLCKPCHDKTKQQEEQATRQTQGVWY
jgi:5-methylcytosine-specific restriction protein A